jgi:hypothetical protein
MSESPATDAAVAAAFGVGTTTLPEPADLAGQAGEIDPHDQQAQVAEDTAFEDLPSSWQDEIRRLRRENAANRVARRDQSRQQQPGGGDSTDADNAPSAQAIRAAEQRGREAARLETGVRLAAAEVKASLAAALTEEQIEDLVEDLNLSRFVTDDGDVDREAVKHFRDKTVSILGRKPTARPGHGQRQTAPTTKSNAELFGEWLHSQ